MTPATLQTLGNGSLWSITTMMAVAWANGLLHSCLEPLHHVQNRDLIRSLAKNEKNRFAVGLNQ